MSTQSHLYLDAPPSIPCLFTDDLLTCFCPPPQDVATGVDSCVTSLTAGHLDQNVVIAGFGDGCVRLYDYRVDNSEW